METVNTPREHGKILQGQYCDMIGIMPEAREMYTNVVRDGKVKE